MFHPAGSSAGIGERLDAFSFTRELTPRARDALIAGVRPIEASRGAVLVEENQQCDPIVLVERGEIRVFKTTEGAREISLYRVHPGESCVLALASMLSRAGYPATAAADDLHGLAIPADLFRSLYGAEPALRGFVMRLFSDRLAGLMELVVEVAFHRMDRRVARFLLEEAEVASGVLRPVERTHEDIAHEVGTSREVVTRILHALESDGLLSLGRGRVRVSDADGLRARLD